MTGRTKSLICIVFLSATASLLGLGLYNTGKFAAMASTSKYAMEQKAPPEALMLNPEPARQTSHASAMVAEAAAPEGLSARSPTFDKPGSGYLQSASEPEKRIVYEQQPRQDTSRQDKLQVYRSLQETCQRWTQWYNKDRSANSAVQMNVACREAADYGRKELNLDTKARRVNPDSGSRKTSTGGEAILIEKAPAKNDSPRCQSLRRELDNIQSRLRAGYKVREGERLKKRRREVRDEIQQRC